MPLYNIIGDWGQEVKGWFCFWLFINVGWFAGYASYSCKGFCILVSARARIASVICRIGVFTFHLGRFRLVKWLHVASSQAGQA
jgi:hypothetical protein